jgi:hypothetical protein
LTPCSFDLICTNPPFGTPKFGKSQGEAKKAHEKAMQEILQAKKAFEIETRAQCRAAACRKLNASMRSHLKHSRCSRTAWLGVKQSPGRGGPRGSWFEYAATVMASLVG